MEKRSKLSGSDKKVESTDTDSDIIFCENNVTNIKPNEQEQYSKAELNRIKVFKYIEKTQPTTIYRIHKELSMAYNTVSYIVRDLIFAGVVSDKMVINEKNVASKELTIPKGRKMTKYKEEENE